MAKDIKIKIGVEIDSAKTRSELDKTLKGLEKNKIKIGFDIDTKSLNSLKKTLESFKNIKINFGDGGSKGIASNLKNTSNAVKETNKVLQEQKNIYSQLGKLQNEEFSIKKKLVTAQGEYKTQLQSDLKTVQNTQQALTSQLKTHEQSASMQKKQLDLATQREKKERDLAQTVAKNQQAMQSQIDKAISGLGNKNLDTKTIEEYTQKLQAIDKVSMGHVKGEISRITSELNNSKVSAQQMADSFNTIGNGFNSLGNGILAMTAPLVAAGAYSVKIGHDFEYGMAKVKAITGATEGEFNKLTEAARHYGKTTVFSSKEASEALQYMG